MASFKESKFCLLSKRRDVCTSRLNLNFEHRRCNVVNRRNISIGIPLNLSIPTEMGYSQLLVENENSAILCYSNLC